MKKTDRGFFSFQKALENLIEDPCISTYSSTHKIYEATADYLKDFYFSFNDDYADDSLKLVDHRINLFNYGVSLVKKKQSFEDSIEQEDESWARKRLSQVRGAILQRSIGGFEDKKNFYSGLVEEQEKILGMYKDVFDFLKEAIDGFNQFYYPLCETKKQIKVANCASKAGGDLGELSVKGLKSSLFSLYGQWKNYVSSLNNQMIDYDSLNRRFRRLNDFIEDLKKADFSTNEQINLEAKEFFENVRS